MKVKYYIWRFMNWTLRFHTSLWQDEIIWWLEDHFNQAESDKYFETLEKWGHLN